MRVWLKSITLMLLIFFYMFSIRSFGTQVHHTGKGKKNLLTHDLELQYIALAISLHIRSEASVVTRLGSVQTLQRQITQPFLIA